MNKILPLSSIIIPPRARTDYGDIPDLARKIMSTKGLKFNDIVVEERDGGYYLLAGGRRCKAHELILSGSLDVWPIKPTPEQLAPYLEVPCRILKDLTEEDRILIEFVENMGRKDFAWPEASSLVQSFHAIKQAKFGIATSGPGKTGWSMKDTAQALGLQVSEVFEYLKLHEGLQTNPHLKDIKQKSKASTHLKRAKKQEIADLLDVTDFLSRGIEVICGDSEKVLASMPEEPTFDLILTDPPWDIDFEARISEMRKESLQTVYDKDYDVMTTLNILIEAYKRLKDDSPIYMFYSSFPDKTVIGQKLLAAAGFSIEPIPLIWNKKHVLAHNARESRHNLNYETILYGWKGNRPLLNQPSRNIFDCQVAFQDRIHSSEKPKELLAEIILLHTQEGGMVLDLFGGSCKVADACLGINRRCLVVEKDEGLVKMASLRLRGI